MSLKSGRKSAEELISQAQKQLTVADTVIPCVSVTEMNWRSLISAQNSQIEILNSITETLPTLTTKKEMTVDMIWQLAALTEYIEETKVATEEFQESMMTTAENMSAAIRETLTETERRVGRVSEGFSSKLSLAEDRMQEHMDKMFWASLIPSAILLILELVRHILSATSVI